MQVPQASSGEVAPRTRIRVLVWLLVALGVVLFVAANAHLVTVAFQSQPKCVEHERLGTGGAGYSAADSAC